MCANAGLKHQSSILAHLRMLLTNRLANIYVAPPSQDVTRSLNRRFLTSTGCVRRLAGDQLCVVIHP